LDEEKRRERVATGDSLRDSWFAMLFADSTLTGRGVLDLSAPMRALVLIFTT
jgi:hypothetical protein